MLIGNFVGDSSIIIYDQLDSFSQEKLNDAMVIDSGEAVNVNEMEEDRMDLDEETLI